MIGNTTDLTTLSNNGANLLPTCQHGEHSQAEMCEAEMCQHDA